MGLSDRDYAREESSGFHLRAPETAVGALIALNVGIFLLDLLFEGRISSRLELRSDLFEHPWNCWQLITSGFVHNPNRFWHILGNMLGLWFFGGDVERLYGRAEFFRIYLASIVVGSLCWLLSQNFLMPVPATYMLGASGAVTCIWVLFALNFPNRMILFLGFLPMPAWILGLYYVVRDLGGFIDGLKGLQLESTAFEAHLGGAMLALAYQRFGWNFGRWLPRSVTMSAPRFRIGPRPKLKLHQPSAEEPNLDTEVDRLLAKITAGGYDSLTDEEKRFLERASGRYQKRRS
jgi:membrane associated rhomboid family serine protease